MSEAFSFESVVLERGGRRILDGVSDHIHAGAVTAIIGDSGAGKSTMLRLFNRLEDPTSGTIRFKGELIDSVDVHQLRKRVSLVGQTPVMLSTAVLEELRIAAPELAQDRALELLGQVALADCDLDRETATMSGGERQRLALARALTVDPEVLLLDEPTSSLDDASATAVDRVIRTLVESGLTVVLVSHDLDRVQGVADFVLVLEKGRLVERGSPEQVRYLL
ncbi:MAG: ATP-binding cassette domain-containing protein [Actinobacteria bacterium]|nr:ATP-binding cassette domain-containing protein [Actinomycetota bacterium]